MTKELNKIKTKIKNRLSTKRYEHVLGVLNTATMLAGLHGVNPYDAAVSALLHDVAKEMSLKQLESRLVLNEDSSYLPFSNKVWHAPVGAWIACEEFGIENDDILNAIRYHTTGRANMSTLEKLLFVADYTEPNRTFKGSEIVRELWTNLDAAVLEILRQKVDKVQKSGQTSHPDTKVALAFYETNL